MKRFVALVLAFLMALTGTVALAGPSKTVNDMTQVKVATNTGVQMPADIIVGFINPDTDPVVAQKKADALNLMLNITMKMVNTSTAADAPKSAADLMIRSALENMTNIIKQTEAQPLDTTVPAVTEEGVQALNDAIANSFAVAAGLTVEEIQSDPEKLTELLALITANDVVQVDQLNYDPSYGDVVVNYVLPTQYEVGTPLLIMLDTIVMDDADSTAEQTDAEAPEGAEDTLPLHVMMPLEAIVNEDGSISVTYTPEALAQIGTENTVSMIVTMTLGAPSAPDATDNGDSQIQG